MPKIFPHLWFNNQAEEAMAFYMSIFKDSKILERTALPDPELSVVRFELAGQPVVALNANSPARYNEASPSSSRPPTRPRPTTTGTPSSPTAARNSPAAGSPTSSASTGRSSPTRLCELIADPDRAKADRVLQAMYKMKKIVIADLERAYRG